ncbi:MAG: GNAT family N-acetyltransferase [Planctomycetia bacterium]|nr:GNAT family N-acetyltransferase [Planctomycetia bacterium]
MTIVYRAYRNDDNPGLVDLWNSSLTTRGCCKGIKPFFLELQWFCKPWFEPAALQLALDTTRQDSKQIIGAALAGFGAAATKDKVDYAKGVVSLLLVHADYRRQGIGTKLLKSAEGYLKSKGTTDARFGCNADRMPYCWGMLGSISPAGVLKSMTGVDLFIEKQGYTAAEKYEIYHRQMTQAISWGDPRFTHLRRKYEMRNIPRPVINWYDEALHGGMETTVFQLLDSALEQPVAELRAAEMTQFLSKNQPPQAGLYDLKVKEELRGQGLGKFLMAHTLQHLNDQMFQVVETVISSDNTEARKMLTSLGFILIDEGISYAKTLR